MAFFNWDDKYSVGIRELDLQHKQLFNILNELYEAMQDASAKDKIGKIIGELSAYTKMHFSTEEKYLEKYNYGDIVAQKAAHANFIAKVDSFKSDYDAGKLLLSLNMANFVKDWLTSHIAGADKKYGPYLNQKGVA